MKKIEITAYELAQRFIGIQEVPGISSNPQVLAMLHLDASWPVGDDVPWCSAFVNYIAWLLRLPRSKSLSARSWLTVGFPPVVPEVGNDVVILKRGPDPQPGAEVIDAPGHVGFFGGFLASGAILVLGGNQSDGVNVAMFNSGKILGYRRLL